MKSKIISFSDITYKNLSLIQPKKYAKINSVEFNVNTVVEFPYIVVNGDTYAGERIANIVDANPEIKSFDGYKQYEKYVQDIENQKKQNLIDKQGNVLTAMLKKEVDDMWKKGKIDYVGLNTVQIEYVNTLKKDEEKKWRDTQDERRRRDAGDRAWSGDGNLRGSPSAGR